MSARRSAKPLLASASAPALHRDGGAYAHSERVERRVPPLALVPLDQLHEVRRGTKVDDDDEDVAEGARQRAMKEGRNYKIAARQKREKQEKQIEERLYREEQQQQLGERFLGMMALLARLRRVNLEDNASVPKPRQQAQPHSSRRHNAPHESPRHLLPAHEPSAFEKLVETKKRQQQEARSGHGGADGRPAEHTVSPHKKPEPVVNVATAPLREHLTFEISMLLPPPMDTRQSALQSPIPRAKRRTRLPKKRRRRKRRPTGAVRVDGKRTWQTSHATWVAHASVDYAQARAVESMAASAGSKLVAKFAALRPTAAASTVEKPAKQYLYATGHGQDRRRVTAAVRATRGGASEREESTAVGNGEVAEPVEQEEEEDDQWESGNSAVEEEDSTADDSEAEEAADASEEEEADHFEALPELLPTTILASSRPLRRGAPSAPLSSVLHRPVTSHQPAWISPELRTWLLQTGLFRSTATTTTTTAAIPSSSSSSSSAS